MAGQQPAACPEGQPGWPWVALGSHPPSPASPRGRDTHVLQAGAVLVLVQVMLLPKAQQAVEVVEQEARVLLAVLHALEQPQVQGQPLFPPGQHQDHEAGVEAADVLLQGQRQQAGCRAAASGCHWAGRRGSLAFTGAGTIQGRLPAPCTQLPPSTLILALVLDYILVQV